MRRVGPVRPLRGQRFGINIAWFSTVSLQGCSERRLCSCVLGEFPIDLADETSSGLDLPPSVNGHRKCDTFGTRRGGSGATGAGRSEKGSGRRASPGPAVFRALRRDGPGGGRVDGLGELGMAAHPVAVAPDVDHVAAVQ